MLDLEKVQICKCSFNYNSICCNLSNGIVENERIIELLWRAAFIVPMLKWLLDTIKKLNKDISRLQELDSDINNNETKTMEDLQDIQKVIFSIEKGVMLFRSVYTIYLRITMKI